MPSLRPLLNRIVLLSILLNLVSMPALAAPLQQGGWLTPWYYQTTLSVSNPNAAALSNYQVLVTLGSSFDFSRAASDGSDVRITDTDGTTLLPFWIETWNPTGQQARLWVKVPTLAANSAHALYMYYGHAVPAPSSASNGDTTFDFFDDFDSTPTWGYYNLSSPGVTVLQQDQAWETSAPHTLSVVEMNAGGYTYWGYYGLEAYPGGGPIGLARSNDLATWDKYSANPVIPESERWPAVLKVGNILYMVYTQSSMNGGIVLVTSSDGINFAAVKTIVQPETGYHNGNPDLFYNTLDSQYYLYWTRINNSTGGHEILARSASSIENLDTAGTTVVLSSGATLAAPDMMYRDGTYFLTVERFLGSIWQTQAWTSSSPTSGFTLLPGNPVLADDSACFSQHVFGTTLHAYYCKLTDGTTWTIEHRTADLTAGRIRAPILDSSRWTASGGTWSVLTATQQDGTSGYVANATLTGAQIAYSSFSGGDYVAEVYGKQVSDRMWGLGVRAADVNNLYSINLYEDLDGTNNLYLYRWVSGSPTVVANTAVGTINANTWYKMTLKVHGNNLDVYLNDVLRLQATDAQFASGRVALYGESGTVAQFNNVLVRQYAANEPTVTVDGSATDVTLTDFRASNAGISHWWERLIKWLSGN